MHRITPFVLLTSLLLAAAARAEEETPAPARREVKEILADLKAKEVETRLAAVEEARERNDPDLTSQFIRMLKDRDPDVRVGVIEALGERRETSCRKKAALALAPRLKPLSGPGGLGQEYAEVIQALHDLAEPSAVKPLMDFDIDEDPDTAKARLMAVANTPCKEAIEALITFMSQGRRRGRNKQRDACVQALVYATGQKHGNDPDKWRQWWREVEKDWNFDEAAEDRAAKREQAREKEARQEEKRQKREDRQRERDGGE